MSFIGSVWCVSNLYYAKHHWIIYTMEVLIERLAAWVKLFLSLGSRFWKRQRFVLVREQCYRVLCRQRAVTRRWQGLCFGTIWSSAMVELCRLRHPSCCLHLGFPVSRRYAVQQRFYWKSQGRRQESHDYFEWTSSTSYLLGWRAGDSCWYSRSLHHAQSLSERPRSWFPVS